MVGFSVDNSIFIRLADYITTGGTSRPTSHLASRVRSARSIFPSPFKSIARRSIVTLCPTIYLASVVESAEVTRPSPVELPKVKSCILTPPFTMAISSSSRSIFVGASEP